MYLSYNSGQIFEKRISICFVDRNAIFKLLVGTIYGIMIQITEIDLKKILHE